MHMRLNKTPDTGRAVLYVCRETPPTVPAGSPPSHVASRDDTAPRALCARLERMKRAGRPRCLIVADTEVLHLAVAEVAAGHDVEFARDPAGDVLCVKLRLPLQHVGMSRIYYPQPSASASHSIILPDLFHKSRSTTF
jgi:hypothetical protein